MGGMIMGFWIFMALMTMLLPACMIFFGRRFMENPPEEINSLYGYRTYRSMKNPDTWQFAHQYFGKIWYRWGLWLLPASLIPLLFFIGKGEDAIGVAGVIILGAQMIPLIIPIILTEIALRKHFDKDGNRIL